MTPEMLARLRALRLWHWKQVVDLRKAQNRFIRENTTGSLIRAEQKKIRANMHIGFVQTLNEFFEPGDTADGDAKKC